MSFKVIILIRCADCGWLKRDFTRKYRCTKNASVELPKDLDVEKEIWDECDLEDFTKAGHRLIQEGMKMNAEGASGSVPMSGVLGSIIISGQPVPTSVWIGGHYDFKDERVQVRGIDLDRIGNARVRFEYLDTQSPKYRQKEYTSLKNFEKHAIEIAVTEESE